MVLVTIGEFTVSWMSIAHPVFVEMPRRGAEEALDGGDWVADGGAEAALQREGERE